MKKLLLFAAGAMMAMSASAQWAVVGNYCDWSFQTATTFTGEGNELSCTIESLTSGFKIVDITNNSWDIQYGTATPLEVGQSYVLDAKDGGQDPADMTFANSVFAIKDAVVTWNPETATLKITGDPQQQEVDASVIYLVGQPQGWGINNDSMPIPMTEEGVYSATYDIKAGDAMFRFYKALGNWDVNSIGSQVADNAIDIALEDGSYKGECVEGKGSWNIPAWEGGNLTIVVNLNDMTVNFSANDAGVESLIDADAPAVYYNLQGVKVNNPQNGIFVVKQGNKTHKVVIR